MSKMTVSALVAASLALTACSGAGAPELAIMDGGNQAELPSWVDSTEGIPLDELTHVGDGDHFSVFASRDEEDDWCVVVAVEPTPESDGSDWVVGASCAPPEHFVENGVWVSTSGAGSNRGAALLLPDDFSGEMPDVYDWERVNDNLAIRR